MDRAMPPDLIVAPARGVLVRAAAWTRVPAVGLRGGRVLAHGTVPDLRARLPAAEVLSGGVVALPGFRDAHVHLLGFATARDVVDCSPAASPDIAALVARIAAAARVAAPGSWIRAGGYDHRLLAERRHPNRDELDRAAPDRPVVLRHRTGHAVVLNTAALRRLGIDETTADPPGGWLGRDVNGRLTGLVVDGDAMLRARGLPHRTAEELDRLVDTASDALAAAGITWICDAGPRNDAETYATLDDLARRGRIRQRWAMLEGFPAFAARDTPDDRFAGVKLVVGTGSGRIEPAGDELLAMLERVHLGGQVAAVHAVDEGSLTVVLDSFAQVFGRHGRDALRHRIEHASVCPPVLANWIAELGLTVVTQPGFVYAHGDRYLASHDLVPDWLYPVRSLLDAGTPVVGSSDIPAGPLEPLIGIAAAVNRRTVAGRVLGGEHAVDLGRALDLYTVAPAACGGGAGTLQPGDVGDVVVLDADPFAVPATELGQIAVRGIVVNGAAWYGASEVG